MNSQKKACIVGIGIAILGIIVIFLPGMIGLKGMSGGFALSTLAILINITGIVTAVIFARRAKILDAMFTGENILVHRTYNPDEWKSYVDKEYKEDKAAKKVLFYVICGFSTVFGLGFTIYDPENGKFVFLVLFGVIAIIAPFAFLQPLLDYQRNRKYLGEVYISRSGVYLNRVLHTWRDLGARLDSVVYEKESRLLQFTYEVPTRSGMQPCNVRVPVPLGEEDTARKLINTFDGDGDVKVETEGIAPVSEDKR